LLAEPSWAALGAAPLLFLTVGFIVAAVIGGQQP